MQATRPWSIVLASREVWPFVEKAVHLRVVAGPLERFADAILWPGGDALDRYAEFYGEGALAPALRCPLPMSRGAARALRAGCPVVDGPLRLLYLNRLERRKGIAELVTAVRSLPEAQLVLTVVGRDTTTGPGA